MMPQLTCASCDNKLSQPPGAACPCCGNEFVCADEDEAVTVLHPRTGPDEDALTVLMHVDPETYGSAHDPFSISIGSARPRPELQASGEDDEANPTMHVVGEPTQSVEVVVEPEPVFTLDDPTVASTEMPALTPAPPFWADWDPRLVRDVMLGIVAMAGGAIVMWWVG